MLDKTMPEGVPQAAVALGNQVQAPVADGVVCQQSTVPSPSPCTGICQLESSTGYCQGCLRTLDEIAAWGQADEAYKRAVVVQLAVRELKP